MLHQAFQYSEPRPAPGTRRAVTLRRTDSTGTGFTDEETGALNHDGETYLSTVCVMLKLKVKFNQRLTFLLGVVISSVIMFLSQTVGTVSM